MAIIWNFSSFQLHLKVSETQHEYFCYFNAFTTPLESFTSSISLLMMANWVHYVFCFHNDSFSLKNIWYLCWQHLTDFNTLWQDYDCSQTTIDFQEVICISCMLTLRTLLFTLNPLSTAASLWLNTNTVSFRPCLTSQ